MQWECHKTENRGLVDEASLPLNSRGIESGPRGGVTEKYDASEVTVALENRGQRRTITVTKPFPKLPPPRVHRLSNGR